MRLLPFVGGRVGVCVRASMCVCVYVPVLLYCCIVVLLCVQVYTDHLPIRSYVGDHTDDVLMCLCIMRFNSCVYVCVCETSRVD